MIVAIIILYVAVFALYVLHFKKGRKIEKNEP